MFALLTPPWQSANLRTSKLTPALGDATKIFLGSHSRVRASI